MPTKPNQKKYATVDAALEAYANGGRGDVIEQAKAEHAAQKAAKAAGRKVPTAPAIEAINKAQAEGLSKKPRKANGTGVKVAVSDEDLAAKVIPELFKQGHHTVGAMSKALRGTPRGTNTGRLRRAFEAAVKAKAIDPSKVEKKAPVAKAAKAPAKKAPAKATTKKAAEQESTTQRGKRIAAQDAVAKRRSARKAS